MKVLIIQPWISYRGAEAVSVLETYYLKKLGHQAKMACLYIDRNRLPPYGNQIEYLLPNKYLGRLIEKSPLFLLFLGIPTLFFLVLKNCDEFDLLNPHNLPSLWIAALVKVFKKIKVVWTVHGVSPEAGFSQNAFNLLCWNVGVKYFDKWAVLKTDHIVAVSRQIKEKVFQRYHLNAEVIYPPIEYQLYLGGNGNPIRKKLGLNKKDFLLLQVSDIQPSKKPEVSLQVLAKLQEKYGHVFLAFVGVKGNSLVLKNMENELNLAGRVFYEPFVDPNFLKNYFTACDMVLVPYWQAEGCPVISIQALISDRPSVIVSGSGADEIMAKLENSYVAKPDLQSFVKEAEICYNEVSKHKNGRQLFMKSRNYIRNNLSGKYYAEQLLILFKQNV